MSTDPMLPKDPMKEYPFNLDADGCSQRKVFSPLGTDPVNQYIPVTGELTSPPEFVQYAGRGWVRIGQIELVTVFDDQLLFWLKNHTSSDDYLPVEKDYIDNFIKVLGLQNVDLTAK